MDKAKKSEKFAVVEKIFEYKGHECICTFNRLGVRCGYVSVDENALFMASEIDCHCGISFQDELPYDYGQTKKYYIGFDCGHICDGRDADKAFEYGLITEYERLQYEKAFFYLDTCPIRDLDYVVENCKKIVDQLQAQVYGEYNENKERTT